MSIKSFLESFTKLTLNSISGLIITLALILLVDSFVSDHISERLLSETETGPLVLIVLAIIVISAVLGQITDSVFSTFGRRFARFTWYPLWHAIAYRKQLMKDIGLSENDFEWIKASGKGLSQEDMSILYVRLAMQPGNSAYAMLLLSIAVGTFLHYESGLTSGMAIFWSFIVAVIASILFLTSAASLAKYEDRKTYLAMDEIRKVSAYRSRLVESSGESFKLKSIFTPWHNRSFLLFAPGGIVFLITIILVYLGINPLREAGMGTITEFEDKQVAVINMAAAIGDNLTATNEWYTSKVLKVAGVATEKYDLVLSDPNGVINLTNRIPDPTTWTLKVILVSEKTVEKGDPILVNASLTLAPKTYPVAGDWTVPIMVTDNNSTANPKTSYILAYIKVTVSRTDTSEAKNVIVETNDDEVPVLKVNINLKGATPPDVYTGASFKIKGEPGKTYDLAIISSDNGTIAAALPDSPEWSLKVDMGSVDSTLHPGDVVYVNAWVSFAFEDKRLDITGIKAGEWIYPVLVQDKLHPPDKYLLCFVKVVITETPLEINDDSKKG